MTPARLAAAMILLSWLFLAMAFLTSCVAVPVPPFGDHLGEMGTLHIRAHITYEPRNPDPAGSDALAYAWTQYGQAKLLRDK